MFIRAALFVACLSSFAAGPLHAQANGEISLAWNDCGAAGAAARTFACNTNAGSEALYVSFRPPAGVTDAYQFEADVVVGNIDLSVLPDWWSLLPTTGCRRTALSASGDFSTAPGGCIDPWNGLAFTSTVVSTIVIIPDGLLRRERIRMVVAVANADAMPLDAATEYYGARIVFSHARTVGSPACNGCGQPMCLALGPASLVTTPAHPNRIVLVQTDRHAVVWNGSTGCDRLAPARNRTWGALKSLYR